MSPWAIFLYFGLFSNIAASQEPMVIRRLQLQEGEALQVQCPVATPSSLSRDSVLLWLWTSPEVPAGGGSSAGQQVLISHGLQLMLVPPDPRIHVDISSGGGYLLHIDRVGPSDAGVYLCQRLNPDDSSHDVLAAVKVEVLPQKSSAVCIQRDGWLTLALLFLMFTS